MRWLHSRLRVGSSHLSRPEHFLPEAHQLDVIHPVTDPFHELTGDQCHRLGMIQAKTPRQTPLSELTGLRQLEMIDFTR